MRLFGLRSITATALSLWLGVLACLLGCAKPAMASRMQSQHRETSGVNCPERDSDAGDSCCKHGHNPNRSGKDEQHAMSCCPTETALIQKQSTAPPTVTHLFAAKVALVDFEAATFAFDDAASSESVPWHAGREILSRVHVLRI
jgi:hypothetical protein